MKSIEHECNWHCSNLLRRVAATLLSESGISNVHLLFSASQKDLQATLDKHLFDDLFASFGIRDQARLTALSHPSGTSSGWLKAIPRVSLGLAIPGPEFVIGLHIWLGVSLFPLSPLCTCLSTIDNYGDHLLGCSQGPMRIRQHDALVNIIYNALSQDHPGVLKEQRASYEMGCALAMFFILASSMVVQFTSMSPYAAPLSLLLSPPVLHVLGWLMLLERLPRMRSIWQLWRRWGQISFH